MWKTYRLYFGGEYVQGTPPLFGFLRYRKITRTTMTFRGRTSEEAKKKARKFMGEANLQGVFRLEEEQKNGMQSRSNMS